MNDPRRPSNAPYSGQASASGAAGDACLLVLDERDSVAVATRELAAGEAVSLRGENIDVREEIPFGHKIALVRIACGAMVVKYGEVIGVATSDIDRGSHVHVHNVVSARLPGPSS